MEAFEFVPSGVCSKKMIIEIENGKIISYKSLGGCPGNSLGVNALIKGMDIDEAINRLANIKCGMRSTSCPDQLSKALIKYKEKEKVASN